MAFTDREVALPFQMPVCHRRSTDVCRMFVAEDGMFSLDGDQFMPVATLDGCGSVDGWLIMVNVKDGMS